MAENERKNRRDELDAFWEIDALIPAKRPPRYFADTEAVEITSEPIKREENASPRRFASEPIANRPDAPKPHYIPPHTPEELAAKPDLLEEYSPENALIRCVRIYPHRGEFRYNECFYRDAKRLYTVTLSECERVPFFSYVPQYAQMNREQLQWYLWWRDCARRGELLDTDYSYVLLYIYEIINLADVMDAEKSRAMLCALWLRYRAIYRQLDGYLPDWICDYCLLHHLPPPDSSLGITPSLVMSHCTLKEFYVPMGGKDGYLLALLAFCSNYDYKKSKFYTKENAPLFDKTVAGALQLVTEHLSADGKLFASAKMDNSRMMRDAYTGALCAQRNKRRIEVEYCSFSRSHELRFFITDVVKYTENKIRGVLGVRSRLSVYALPVSVRTLLDGYLAGALPTKKAPLSKREQELAEYEKLYDLPRTALSLSNAASIERLSWETTERLVEAFEEECEPIAPQPIKTESPTPEPTAEDTDAWGKYRPYLSALLEQDSLRARAAAQALGMPEEVLADEVNSLAADLLGDILLEEADAGFAPIEDYLDTLRELIFGL